MPVDRGSVKHFEMPINQRHGLEAASWNLLLEFKQVGHICLLLFYLPRYSESSAASVTGALLEKFGKGESRRSHAKFVSSSSLLKHSGHFMSCCREFVDNPNDASMLLVGNTILQIHTKVAVSLFLLFIGFQLKPKPELVSSGGH